MRLLYFPREQFSTITADDVTARPLAASVAPIALCYGERSTQANIQHVECQRTNIEKRINNFVHTKIRQLYHTP